MQILYTAQLSCSHGAENLPHVPSLDLLEGRNLAGQWLHCSCTEMALVLQQSLFHVSIM